MGTVTYRKVDVDGIKVFYREAGPKDAPAILLLHGFPTAGHMFRDLIPQLAHRFRLVAPTANALDVPAFGRSGNDCSVIAFEETRQVAMAAG